MSNIVVSDFISEAKRVVQMPDQVGANGEIIKGSTYPALWIEDAYSSQEFMDTVAAENTIRAERDPGWRLHDLWRERVRRFIPTISDEDLRRLTMRQLPLLHDELMVFEPEANEAGPLAIMESPQTSIPEPSSPT